MDEESFYVGLRLAYVFNVGVWGWNTLPFDDNRNLGKKTRSQVECTKRDFMLTVFTSRAQHQTLGSSVDQDGFS